MISSYYLLPRKLYSRLLCPWPSVLEKDDYGSPPSIWVGSSTLPDLRHPSRFVRAFAARLAFCHLSVTPGDHTGGGLHLSHENPVNQTRNSYLLIRSISGSAHAIGKVGHPGIEPGVCRSNLGCVTIYTNDPPYLNTT